WILGASFIAMAAWIMVPDEIDETEASEAPYGVFVATVIAFFLAEMGDKTQVATVALAAQYSSLVAVDCTLRKHVRKPKGAPTGAVLYTHEKTLHVRPAV
ncbi:MAG: TMEM165/GDT1 family protein, partial [Fimbriimonas ginsengisoli]|nr:TMEM165/GDT1 family protein [Fimbriimonas ginsengisoli]